jgi:hypothetical protein
VVEDAFEQWLETLLESKRLSDLDERDMRIVELEGDMSQMQQELESWVKMESFVCEGCQCPNEIDARLPMMCEMCGALNKGDVERLQQKVEEVRQRRLVVMTGGAMRRLRHRGQGMAWWLWIGQLQCTKRWLRAADCMLSRWRNLKASTAMWTWRCYVDERRRLGRRVSKVVYRMQRMRLWTVFVRLEHLAHIARSASVAPGSASGLAVTLKLELDFSMAGREGSRERRSFQKQVVDDLAFAAGCSSDCFRVQSMSAGSTIVRMIIDTNGVDDEDLQAGPSLVLTTLQTQMSDENSRLRSGVFTSRVLSLTADDEEATSQSSWYTPEAALAANASDHAFRVLAFEDLDKISAPGSVVHFVCVHCDSENEVDGNLTLPLLCEICGEDQPLPLTREEEAQKGQRELQMQQALAKTRHQDMVRIILTRGDVRALEHAIDAWRLQAGLHMKHQAWALTLQKRRIAGIRVMAWEKWSTEVCVSRVSKTAAAEIDELQASVEDLKASSENRQKEQEDYATFLKQEIEESKEHVKQSEQWLEELKGKLAKRWSRKTTFAAWSTWAVRAGEAQRLRFLRTRACRRWRHRSVSEAWARWLGQLKEIKHLAKAASKAASRWQHVVCVAPAWTRWVEQGRRQKRLRRWARRVMERRQHLHVSLAFCLLRKRAMDLKGMPIVGSQVAARWQRLRVWRGFTGWSEETARERDLVRAADCMSRRWRNLKISTAMWTWRCDVDERRRLGRVASKVVYRMQRMRLWTAFARLEHLAHMTHLASGEGLINEDQNHIMMLDVSLVSVGRPESLISPPSSQAASPRFQPASSLSPVSAFSPSSFDLPPGTLCRRSVHVASKAARRWRHQAIGRAWECLYGYHVLCMRLKRLIRRLQSLRRVKVFARWDQQATDERRLRMVTGKVAQRGMLRMRAMAWDKWSNEVRAIRASVTAATKESQRLNMIWSWGYQWLRKRRMASSWTCWRMVTKNGLLEMARDRRRDYVARKIVFRWHKQTLRRAWQGLYRHHVRFGWLKQELLLLDARLSPEIKSDTSRMLGAWMRWLQAIELQAFAKCRLEVQDIAQERDAVKAVVHQLEDNKRHLLLAAERHDSAVRSWQSQALDAHQQATEFKDHVQQLQRQLEESKVQQDLDAPPTLLRQQNKPRTEKQAHAIGATVGAKSNHQRLSAASPADTAQAGGIAADQLVVEDQKIAEQVEQIEAKDRTITKQLQTIAELEREPDTVSKNTRSSASPADRAQAGGIAAKVLSNGKCLKDMLCVIIVFIVFMVFIAFAPTLLNLQGSNELSPQHGVPVLASARVVSCAESEHLLELERAKRKQCDIELEFSKRDAQLSKREESVLRSERPECHTGEKQRITELDSCRNEVSLSHSKVQLWQDKLLACKQHNAQGANSSSYDEGGGAGVKLGNKVTLGKLQLGAPSNASQHDAGGGGEASLAPPALCKGWYCPRVVREHEPRYGVLSWGQGLQPVETGEFIISFFVQYCSVLTQRLERVAAVALNSPSGTCRTERVRGRESRGGGGKEVY